MMHDNTRELRIWRAVSVGVCMPPRVGKDMVQERFQVRI